MLGSWVVEVEGVRPFTIHGDLYFELHTRRAENPDVVLVLRVPQHAFSSVEPAAGQRWELTFLMGQVTAAKRID
jgi:hypothetical protein